jgi:hypothetical protein
MTSPTWTPKLSVPGGRGCEALVGSWFWMLGAVERCRHHSCMGAPSCSWADDIRADGFWARGTKKWGAMRRPVRSREFTPTAAHRRDYLVLGLTTSNAVCHACANFFPCKSRLLK